MNAIISQKEEYISSRINAVNIYLNKLDEIAINPGYITDQDNCIVQKSLNMLHDKLVDLEDEIYSQEDYAASEDDYETVLSPLYKKFYRARDRFYTYYVCD